MHPIVNLRQLEIYFLGSFHVGHFPFQFQSGHSSHPQSCLFSSPAYAIRSGNRYPIMGTKRH